MMKAAYEIKEEYFNFLYDIVRDSYHRNYNELLSRLHSVPFEVLVERDSNRASDGVYLRYSFCRKAGYDLDIAEFVLDGPCTVLEMMVALAKRMEEDILWDPTYGNRTPVWFWEMIENLGLDDCCDGEFDKEKFDRTIDILLSRSYFSDGFGGLFPLKIAKYDQRRVEIWYQMQQYLAEHFENS